MKLCHQNGKLLSNCSIILEIPQTIEMEETRFNSKYSPNGCLNIFGKHCKCVPVLVRMFEAIKSLIEGVFLWRLDLHLDDVFSDIVLASRQNRI